MCPYEIYQLRETNLQILSLKGLCYFNFPFLSSSSYYYFLSYYFFLSLFIFPWGLDSEPHTCKACIWLFLSSIWGRLDTGIGRFTRTAIKPAEPGDGQIYQLFFITKPHWLHRDKSYSLRYGNQNFTLLCSPTQHNYTRSNKVIELCAYMLCVCVYIVLDCFGISFFTSLFTSSSMNLEAWKKKWKCKGLIVRGPQKL